MMKTVNALFALAVAGGFLSATADDALFFDDFEQASAVRPGQPELVSGMTSPGLLTETHMGVYRGERVTVLESDGSWPVPAAGKVRFAYGYRLYGFGDPRKGPSVLETRLTDETDHLDFVVCHDPSSPTLVARCSALKVEVPYTALPADFVLGFDGSGRTELSVTSLSDSQLRSATGEEPFFKVSRRRFAAKTVLASSVSGQPAEVKLDNLSAAIVTPAKKLGDVPAKIEPLKTFDAAKAGWKLVFEDDFDGDLLDESKWEPRSEWGLKHIRVRDGVLFLETDRRTDGKEGLETGSIWTRQSFLYGYFEARLKFTRQNGWWAAFWLYGDTNVNPFVDGFEIDIFEDYYTRWLDGRGRSQAIIDHNLHMHCGSVTKSWNYMEPLKGSLDDWHTVAVKWTPFEITYYMDGKVAESCAAHSPWTTVTFDAFNHGIGAVPLKAILSGQLMKKEASWQRGINDCSKSAFPEAYQVDWVRVYACPEGPGPAVAWAEDYPSGEYNMVQEGASQVYRVTAAPAAKSGAPVKAVYLFDSGFLLDYRKEPPYDFKVDFTEAYFDATGYARPGRQKLKPRYDGAHALVAFAEDADGNVSKTEPILCYLVSKRMKQSRPYQGRAQAIPGVVRASLFDEGGQGVAYVDSTKGNVHGKAENWRMNEDVDCTPSSVGGVGSGEWINYTVDVAEEGDYEVTLRYGTPVQKEQSMVILCDLKPVGSIKCPSHDKKFGWSVRDVATTTLHLPRGRHVLRLVLNGSYNFTSLTFVRKTAGRSRAVRGSAGDLARPLNPQFSCREK